MENYQAYQYIHMEVPQERRERKRQKDYIYEV